MDEDVHEYEGTAVDVTWDAKRCIHARACVEGLPGVFDTAKRPWIQPDEASVDDVTTVVARCPTGALHAERHDGAPAESTPEENTVEVAAEGPLYVRGDVTVENDDGEILLSDTRLALCRCGASGNKPLCDGAHTDVGFDAGGTVEPADAPDDWTAGGPLTVVPTPDGPLHLQGAFTLAGATDGVERAADDGWLCRCGGSGNKPFCDGTHGKIGFAVD